MKTQISFYEYQRLHPYNRSLQDLRPKSFDKNKLPEVLAITTSPITAVFYCQRDK